MPLSDERLRTALQDAVGPVEELERAALAERSTFPIERVDLVLADGTEQSVVVKELAPSAGGPKPGLLADPRREVAAYAQVLAPRGIRAPALVGSVVDPVGRRSWLLVEAVEGEALWQSAAWDVWEDAARWLAALHATGPPPGDAGLLRYDAEWFRLWPQRALAVAGSDELARVVRGYEVVVDRLAALPATFVHGEFYPSNVMVEDGEGTDRIRPVDWEMAGTGSGLLDIAALTSGRWDEQRRDRLAAVYLEAWAGPGARPGTAVFARDLRLARLHVAMQWLGWSRAWRPPAEHEHDWHADAVRLGEELGL